MNVGRTHGCWVPLSWGRAATVALAMVFSTGEAQPGTPPTVGRLDAKGAPSPKAAQALEDMGLRLADFAFLPDEAKGMGTSASSSKGLKSFCDQCLAGTIGCGQTQWGSLGAGDCTLANGAYIDAYRFELMRNSEVTIQMWSSAFDTYLALDDGTCELPEVIAINDDCNGDLSVSCITMQLTAGTYSIFATSYSAQVTGDYTIDVICAGAEACASCLRGNIGCGQVVTGDLGPDDCARGNESLVDAYRFDLADRARVTVHMRSTAFDTWLSIVSGCPGPSTVAYNDDCSPGNFDLSCVSAFLEPGTYFIYASSYSSGATGLYELEVVECVCPLAQTPSNPSPADRQADVAGSIVTLSWGDVSVPKTVTAGALAKSGLGGEDRKGIYGDDDRLDEYQVDDAALLAAGDATAVIIQRWQLTDNGDGTFSLPAATFAEQYLWGRGRPLCDDEPFRGQPNPGICSAFLVGPDVVATAGHCVSESSYGDIALVFGFVMLDLNTPAVRVDASEVYFPTGVLGRQVDLADWALVRLDRPVSEHAPLPVRRQGHVADGQRVTVIGHPMGLPRKYAGGDQTTVRGNGWVDFFETNVDAYAGNSGSVILNADTLEVEGILVRGNTDYTLTETCDRSARCSDGGCPGWEQATRSVAFSRLLPAYDVEMGTSPARMVVAATDLPVPWFTVGPLEAGVTYYWRVVAKNECGVVMGPIWSFTAAAGATVDDRVHLIVEPSSSQASAGDVGVIAREWTIPTALGRPSAPLDFVVSIQSNFAGTQDGVQGWSVSLLSEPCYSIGGVTFDGTAGAEASADSLGRRQGGFALVEVVNPADNGGREGLVSGVVLSWLPQVCLPPIGKEPVLRIRGEIDAGGVSNAGDRTQPCSLVPLATGPWLIGSGQPIETVVTWRSSNLLPVVEGATVVLEGGDPGFVRGDADQSGTINITDGISTLDFLFGGNTRQPSCRDASDANDDGRIDLSDSVLVFSWLFLGGRAPSQPSPSQMAYSMEDCGADPTWDSLDCAVPICR